MKSIFCQLDLEIAIATQNMINRKMMIAKSKCKPKRLFNFFFFFGTLARMCPLTKMPGTNSTL